MKLCQNLPTASVSQMALRDEDDDIDFSSDMRINFLVNTNQNLTLKLIMDEQSGRLYFPEWKRCNQSQLL